MDWTSVNNAEDTKGRIQALYYLLSIRYEAEPYEAGAKLRKESEANQLCRKVMAELQNELDSASLNLGMGTVFSDEDARTYLQKVFSSYKS